MEDPEHVHREKEEAGQHAEMDSSIRKHNRIGVPGELEPMVKQIQ